MSGSVEGNPPSSCETGGTGAMSDSSPGITTVERPRPDGGAADLDQHPPGFDRPRCPFATLPRKAADL